MLFPNDKTYYFLKDSKMGLYKEYVESVINI